MRIRKRLVPLPLSSLSPVPLSDRLLYRSPVVQDVKQVNQSAPPAYGFPQYQLSDQLTRSLRPNSGLPLMIGRMKEDWICFGHGEQEKETQKHLSGVGRPEVEEGNGGKKNNDIRKRSFPSAEAVAGLIPLSKSYHEVGGGWCKGDITVPLKKRRRSYDQGEENEGKIVEKEKKMKSKTNKKCVYDNNRRQEEEEEEEEEEEVAENEGSDNGTYMNVMKKKKKKKKKKNTKRGGGIMEGSRCSRVNGRGWRCCQQTLVGYSLCEHHLGKGRLRSITNNALGTSLPVTSSTTTRTIAPKDGEDSGEISSYCESKDRESGEQEEEDGTKPFMMVTKKGKKIGKVKARLISSLLGLDNYGVSLVDNNK